MTDFSAEWLALREPVDARARNADVCDAVVSYFQDRPQLSILDIGSGTGSTLRALEPRLGASQRWRLVDHDADLLARATALLGAAGKSFETTPFNFSHSIEPLLEGVTDLVTASALFDLVSDLWLVDFTHSIATRRMPVYIALTYDGRVQLSPDDDLDAFILKAFNSHQLTDKGFGPALGYQAASRAIGLLEASGYKVVQGRSDWVATSADRSFLSSLLRGWADVAHDTRLLDASDIAAWLDRRLRALNAGGLTVRVGHVDFFAYPAMS